MKKPPINGVQPTVTEELLEKQKQLSKNLQAEHDIMPSKKTTRRKPVIAANPKVTKQVTKGYSEAGIVPTLCSMKTLTAKLALIVPPYVPILEEIALPALEADTAQAQELINAAMDSENAALVMKAERKAAFDKALVLGPRIISALKACAAPAEVVTEAQGYLNDMRGKGLLPVTDKHAKRISRNQTSFNNRAQHFRNLVQVVVTCEVYDSHVDALKEDALVALSDALYAYNVSATQAGATLSAAKTARNVFFNMEMGFCDKGNLAKQTARSILGPRSKEYREISDLKFTKIKE